MKIQISDDRSIREIQEDFQKEYPFLKIEFYRPQNKLLRQRQKPQPISSNSPIEAIRRVSTIGDLDISEERKIEEVEGDLKNIFGLNAEIFRKSGNLWIETSLTVHWSLRQQNIEGKQISYATVS